MSFVYVEMRRQVRPVREYEKFCFFMLGSFDVMDIAPAESIEDLKKTYESKHIEVPELFDRQPVFLYTPDALPGINEKSSIFYRSEDDAVRPLVLTLFQLDKNILANQSTDNVQTPGKLISRFAQLIQMEMENQGANNEDIRYQVFWNLGEADIAVVFRPRTVTVLSNILHNFHTKYGALVPIRIISTWSHCAFPKPEVLGRGRKKETIISKPLEQWIQNEFQAGGISGFVTLFNTSAGYYNAKKGMKFLLGDWDYMCQYEGETGKKELTAFLKETFLSLVRKNKEKLKPSFRISCTFPVFTNEEEGIQDNTSGVETQDLRWIKYLSASIKALCKEITGVLPGERGEALGETVQSFNRSITGLAKFLYRLRKGRFEEDLYKYVQPVFIRLRAITNSYRRNICELKKDGNWEQIDVLVKEYISSTAMLIEGLQHLFSIMAVSPHTFIETHGSSMRSLTASDKLLDAYQGMVRFLKDTFPDVMTGKKLCNREILVFPYRKAQAAHTLLYPHSASEDRLSYIQVDFTKMFRLRIASFLLLHECGHHLGDRLREKRFECFAGASVCLAFEWMGLQVFLHDPIGGLISRMNDDISKERKQQERESLFLKISQDIQTKYEKIIQEIAQDGICDLSTYYCIKVRKRYLNAGKKVSFLRKQYKNYFSEQMLEFLRESFLPQIFGIYEEDSTQEDLNACLEQQRQIILNLDQLISRRMAEAARDLSEEIAEKKGNVREGMRLRAIYEEEITLAKDMKETGMHIVSDKLRNRGLEGLYSVFSDIHADIFAIRILELELMDYIGIIVDALGTEVNEIRDGMSPLFRVYVVSKAVWKNVDDQQVLDGLAENDETLKVYLQRQWEIFKNTSYLKYLLEYAGDCKNRMDECIEEAIKEKKAETALNQIRNIFGKNPEAQIGGIYYFCRYLMRRDKTSAEE